MTLNPFQLLFAILFTLTLTVKAQVKPVNYNAMPANGITLDTGWRYSPQDNPQFAEPAFNDASWGGINPIYPPHRIPQLKGAKIGWLRLHFKTGPNLGSRPFIFDMLQSAASEIYLDGKLIGKYGTLSANPSNVVPLGLNLQNQEVYLTQGAEHVFAVRIAPWRGPAINSNWLYLCQITLIDANQYIEITKTTIKGDEVYIALTSVFFLLSLLHLAFYRYDPTQRANLFFAVYAIISTLGFLGVVMQGEVQDCRIWLCVYVPAFLTTLMGAVWVIRALGTLFSFKINRLEIGLWCVYIITSFLIIFWQINRPFFTGLIIFGLVQIWLTVKALRMKKRGAGIIASGFAVSVVALAPFLFGVTISDLTHQLLILILFLAPALGISLYLAREFALDSSLLRKKLVQVETLSVQNLAQEQEKQQLLARQNDNLENEVAVRTSELQRSLSELKSAQTQLIQSEKMASLGELTAGIAHEIQNPLNFVNNFSDVNREMIDELKEELKAGNIDEALAIANDIQQNEEKIIQHGKRADNIVKGMLQHSRSNTGERQLSDINTIADEFLKLSYHGLRAKDKSFNADLVTHFAESLPSVNMVPQNIGRVLLNLFNNAFYAVNQKKKIAGADYKPTVEVTTVLKDNFIEIIVKDNGQGVSDAIKDKIMQPFFTTKPTGEGTGLGLSLSYDIIVKGHSGSIAIESTEGLGASFIIKLPLTSKNNESV
ncbi:sensor histidine kinase [Mucilaginibacter polytrichastri]|uniref:histidine kinase n=1 Tax=Mucilaginibacter polytrichastri TaxID=1302689 RepID=A0A1Q6A064_9SPHI|nr:ATP-binding protein [Mucilaginibacter polytrichastri]OKS87409.1 hypothetical protein RG47T_2870 [Mucilaginibacter polytrichastri]SFS90277.1 His Kinase A (phospho-acceptor) domain-containing protein [Mucilaginibacter polytrichastri]